MKLFFIWALIIINSSLCLHSEEIFFPSPHSLDSPFEVSLKVDEFKAIENLMQLTYNNYLELQAIKELILDYQKHREAFEEDSEDKVLACNLISRASNLLNKINENHLLDVFSNDFIEELTFFSQIANRKPIPLN